MATYRRLLRGFLPNAALGPLTPHSYTPVPPIERSMKPVPLPPLMALMGPNFRCVAQPGIYYDYRNPLPLPQICFLLSYNVIFKSPHQLHSYTRREKRISNCEIVLNRISHEVANAVISSPRAGCCTRTNTFIPLYGSINLIFSISNLSITTRKLLS